MAATPSPAGADRAGPRKREVVAELTEKLGRATSAIVTDYRGLTVKQLEELRASLRNDGVEYVVVKNTLARRAAAEAGVDIFSPALVGPVGLALGYGEVNTPAKLLGDYFRLTRRLPMMSGLVEKQLLTGDQVKELASLPGREVLLSQLAGTLLGPVSALAGSLESAPAMVAGALAAYQEKLETAA